MIYSPDGLMRYNTASRVDDIPLLSQWIKKYQVERLGIFFGGELGIRTLGEFPHTAFRVLHLRPLGQLSVYVENNTKILAETKSNVKIKIWCFYFSAKKNNGQGIQFR